MSMTTAPEISGADGDGFNQLGSGNRAGNDYKGAAILQHVLSDSCTFLADGGSDTS